MSQTVLSKPGSIFPPLVKSCQMNHEKLQNPRCFRNHLVSQGLFHETISYRVVFYKHRPCMSFPKHTEENPEPSELKDLSLLSLQPNRHAFLHPSHHISLSSQMLSSICYRSLHLALPFAWDALSPEPHMAHSFPSLSLPHMSSFSDVILDLWASSPHFLHWLLSDSTLCLQYVISSWVI